jgi:hypothetical protein
MDGGRARDWRGCPGKLRDFERASQQLSRDDADDVLSGRSTCKCESDSPCHDVEVRRRSQNDM